MARTHRTLLRPRSGSTPPVYRFARGICQIAKLHPLPKLPKGKRPKDMKEVEGGLKAEDGKFLLPAKVPRGKKSEGEPQL